MILKKSDKRIEHINRTETHKFDIMYPSDHESIVILTRQIARKVGFKTTDEYLIATSASELATNIFRYAGKGEMIINIVHCEHGNGLEIIANDLGPGIKDVDEAIQDHYTTTDKSLGMGLPSVLRIMDEFEIDSKLNDGTRIVTRKWSWS